MKLLILVMAFVLAVSGGVLAQAPVQPYVGIFVDENREGWCATGTPVYEVEWWLWVLPGENGVRGLAFNMPLPSSVSRGDGVRNPSLMFGSIKCQPPCPDYMFSILMCLTDWTWIYHETLLVSSVDPVVVQVLNFPDSSESITVENCISEEEPVVRLTDLYINYPLDGPECTGMASDSKSWGAIKTLIDR
jgi:hypothetical protein